MRAYRDIAFPVRAHFEPQFFLLHVYQTNVYVAIFCAFARKMAGLIWLAC